MIVRCTQCDSAFAVDDGKVKDKRFAFTCPKCATENIIDNRKAEPIADSPIADTGAEADSGTPFFDEPPQEEKTPGAEKEEQQGYFQGYILPYLNTP